MICSHIFQVQQFQFKRIIFYGKYQFDFDLIKETFASPYSYDYCKILIRKVSSCTQQDSSKLTF